MSYYPSPRIDVPNDMQFGFYFDYASELGKWRKLNPTRRVPEHCLAVDPNATKDVPKKLVSDVSDIPMDADEFIDGVVATHDGASGRDVFLKSIRKYSTHATSHPLILEAGNSDDDYDSGSFIDDDSESQSSTHTSDNEEENDYEEDSGNEVNVDDDDENDSSRPSKGPLSSKERMKQDRYDLKSSFVDDSELEAGFLLARKAGGKLAPSTFRVISNNELDSNNLRRGLHKLRKYHVKLNPQLKDMEDMIDLSSEADIFRLSQIIFEMFAMDKLPEVISTSTESTASSNSLGGVEKQKPLVENNRKSKRVRFNFSDSDSDSSTSSLLSSDSDYGSSLSSFSSSSSLSSSSSSSSTSSDEESHRRSKRKRSSSRKRKHISRYDMMKGLFGTIRVLKDMIQERPVVAPLPVPSFRLTAPREDVSDDSDDSSASSNSSNSANSETGAAQGAPSLASTAAVVGSVLQEFFMLLIDGGAASSVQKSSPKTQWEMRVAPIARNVAKKVLEGLMQRTEGHSGASSGAAGAGGSATSRNIRTERTRILNLLTGLSSAVTGPATNAPVASTSAAAGAASSFPNPEEETAPLELHELGGTGSNLVSSGLGSSATPSFSTSGLSSGLGARSGVFSIIRLQKRRAQERRKPKKNAEAEAQAAMEKRREFVLKQLKKAPLPSAAAEPLIATVTALVEARAQWVQAGLAYDAKLAPVYDSVGVLAAPDAVNNALHSIIGTNTTTTPSIGPSSSDSPLPSNGDFSSSPSEESYLCGYPCVAQGLALPQNQFQLQSSPPSGIPAIPAHFSIYLHYPNIFQALFSPNSEFHLATDASPTQPARSLLFQQYVDFQDYEYYYYQSGLRYGYLYGSSPTTFQESLPAILNTLSSKKKVLPPLLFPGWPVQPPGYNFENALMNVFQHKDGPFSLTPSSLYSLRVPSRSVFDFLAPMGELPQTAGLDVAALESTNSKIDASGSEPKSSAMGTMAIDLGAGISVGLDGELERPGAAAAAADRLPGALASISADSAPPLTLIPRSSCCLNAISIGLDDPQTVPLEIDLVVAQLVESIANHGSGKEKEKEKEKDKSQFQKESIMGFLAQFRCYPAASSTLAATLKRAALGMHVSRCLDAFQNATIKLLAYLRSHFTHLYETPLFSTAGSASSDLIVPVFEEANYRDLVARVHYLGRKYGKPDGSSMSSGVNFNLSQLPKRLAAGIFNPQLYLRDFQKDFLPPKPRIRLVANRATLSSQHDLSSAPGALTDSNVLDITEIAQGEEGEEEVSSEVSGKDVPNPNEGSAEVKVVLSENAVKALAHTLVPVPIPLVRVTPSTVSADAKSKLGISSIPFSSPQVLEFYYPASFSDYLAARDASSSSAAFVAAAVMETSAECLDSAPKSELDLTSRRSCVFSGMNFGMLYQINALRESLEDLRVAENIWRRELQHKPRLLKELFGELNMPDIPAAVCDRYVLWPLIDFLLNHHHMLLEKLETELRLKLECTWKDFTLHPLSHNIDNAATSSTLSDVLREFELSGESAFNRNSFTYADFVSVIEILNLGILDEKSANPAATSNIKSLFSAANPSNSGALNLVSAAPLKKEPKKNPSSLDSNVTPVSELSTIDPYEFTQFDEIPPDFFRRSNFLSVGQLSNLSVSSIDNSDSFGRT